MWGLVFHWVVWQGWRHLQRGGQGERVSKVSVLPGEGHVVQLQVPHAVARSASAHDGANACGVRVPHAPAGPGLSSCTRAEPLQKALLSDRCIQAILLNALWLRTTAPYYARRLHLADSGPLRSTPVQITNASAVRSRLVHCNKPQRATWQQQSVRGVKMETDLGRARPRRGSCASPRSAARPSRGAAAPGQRATRNSVGAPAPPASPCTLTPTPLRYVLPPDLLCTRAKGQIQHHNTGCWAQC